MLLFQPNSFYIKTFLVVLTVSFLSCKKSTDAQQQDDLYKNSLSTSIPAALKGGLWFWGSIGPVSYYDRDGHEVGNGTEAARQYNFTEVQGQGRLEFTQYLGLRNASNCVTEIYTTKKGTVVFEGVDKLTFYPVEGNFKTVKKGCSENGTTTRKAEGADLKPETLLWEIDKSSGKPLLYIYNSTDTAKQNPVFVYSFAQ
ncbi:hypothetical protein [Flavisolibacter ginsenosidimutans]|uniref:hypothetical protein n=1 Tax=Flavisolibacter ginsenosidimutans TaxID=661481 RepID=UPI0018840B41|nr:hypothetical protein [Flavisolibacter ginsenosidimutans]